MAGAIKREADFLDDDFDFDDLGFLSEDSSPPKDVVKKVVKQRRRTPKREQLPIPSEDLMAKLPGELRNRIYELVLPFGQTFHIRERRHIKKMEIESWYRSHPPNHLAADSWSRWGEPALLKVSKTIRQETQSLYYDDNDFTFTVRPRELGEVRESLLAKFGDEDGIIHKAWSVRLLDAGYADEATTDFAKMIYRTETPWDAQPDDFVRDAGWPRGTVAYHEVAKLALNAKARELGEWELEEDVMDWGVAKRRVMLRVHSWGDI